MNTLSFIAIAIGLSMDAFSVSIVNGCVIKGLRLRTAVGISFSFGFFQALMPVIGWAAGISFYEYIRDIDHWVVLGILSFIGGKMIIESRSLKKEEDCKTCLHLPTLLLLSLATSIDALAVGLSFAFLNISIIIPIAIIGSITFIICFAGIQIGKKLGHFFENRFELFGGIILILIGAKIAIEHVIKHI